MLTIEVKSDVSRQSREVKQEIRRRHHELLDTLGVQLLSLTLQAYNEKARGRTGSDGIVWKPLKESTKKAKQRRGRKRRPSRRSRRGSSGGTAGPTGSTETMIGVDTGLQRASAQPGNKDNIFNVDAQISQVTVGFGRSYSEHFDEQRKLLPDELPQDWEDDLSETIDEHYSGILKKFEE